MAHHARIVAAGVALAVAQLTASFADADQLSPPKDNVPAQADLSGAGNDAHLPFDALDANKDGRLGRDEVAARALLAKAFDTHDGDNDGTLTRAEYEDYVALEGTDSEE